MFCDNGCRTSAIRKPSFCQLITDIKKRKEETLPCFRKNTSEEAENYLPNESHSQMNERFYSSIRETLQPAPEPPSETFAPFLVTEACKKLLTHLALLLIRV